MAGDWLKIEKITPDKPEVIRMATILKRDSDEIFGKLFRIWVWADDQTVGGGGMEITEEFLDKKAGKKGFAKAMRAVGWLSGVDGSLMFPGFHRHNGETAKARAETNRRVAKHRTGNGETVTSVTPEPLQKPLPEKRREESNTPLPPFQGGESERVSFLIGKIQSLRPRWLAIPSLCAKDERAFRKNFRILDAFEEEHWDVQREFLAAEVPKAAGYWQPDQLGKYLADPGGVLGHAMAWKSKQRPKLELVKLPTGIPATPEERAEIFAALQPKRMNS